MDEQVSELAISSGANRKPREVVPEATYVAAYRNVKVYMNEKGYGGKPEKVAKLFFVITQGPQQGKVVSFKGNFFRTDEGDWIIGAKSNLAEAIRGITRGGGVVNDSHRGLKCTVHVKNKKSSRDGVDTVYDFIDNVLAVPDDNTKVDVEALIKARADKNGDTSFPPADRPTAKVGAAASAPTAQPDLLSDLADLSDFEAA